MAITSQDITLDKFLEKFTCTNEQDKVNLPVESFLQIASLLKISLDLGRLKRALR